VRCVFADTELAARRLALVAEVFAPSWIRANHPPPMLDRLAEDLGEIAAVTDGRTSIEWRLRQVVLEGA